ncbi:hypothetical protein IPV08_19125 [Methylobacterium sp. SD274]|jgi:hypothetical protein|uniref:Uncharacterized protein n=1 Tax=Methylobacterium gossipiicola TaxID=582675 RepID=A0A1I2V520_9HYPH|nr:MULTISPECIES: hypothetical protein [Methylobacterium]KQO66532.1 hypothetical protein ASF18_13750 [Methylobacterium sp. Leaf89]MBO1022073.1 hypothetical protein [Methylobacterium sp. SD274]SFG82356.1 hypothetical protein SAMN05192565_112101 [Methylobacterium gossipiicola]
MSDVYWHRARRLWSVREAGRVVAHVPAIALSGVAFRASEAGRLRCLRTGCRDVHAWAVGSVCEVSRTGDAVRIRYRIETCGFRVGDRVITKAARVWFEADGAA